MEKDLKDEIEKIKKRLEMDQLIFKIGVEKGVKDLDIKVIEEYIDKFFGDVLCFLIKEVQ